ncbi:MAG: NAD(P)/FAD-dependent oxidoreductase [Terrimesophilobacter sp.]
MDAYDLIVIGAGATGENVADRATAGGLRVVIIEAELVGGECSYWACMPSKALLRSAAALRAAQRVSGARQAITGELDVKAVLARRDKASHQWNDELQVEWLASAGVDLIRGIGRISGEKEVTVTHEDGSEFVLTAQHAVAVCTGTSARIPDISGLRDSQPWTSREVTSVQEIHDRLAIMGGGVVGVEMATAYAGLGAAVILFARGGLLSGDEPFAGEMVKQGLEDLGAEVLLGVEATSVRRHDGLVTITMDDGSTITANELLVATGRAPRTHGLGLDAIGQHEVGLRDGDWIEVDDTMRVPGIDWLYAVGDVNHRALLTHQGKYQARAAGAVIAARARGEAVDHEPWSRFVATADRHAVPQVTFTDPEVASVGYTEASARKAGIDIRVIDRDLGRVAGASLHAGGYRGQVRMIVDENRKVIIGMTFVGQDVGELLHAATIAIVGEVPLDRLWHAVPAYPTMSEIWLRLFEEYRG